MKVRQASDLLSMDLGQLGRNVNVQFPEVRSRLIKLMKDDQLDRSSLDMSSEQDNCLLMERDAQRTSVLNDILDVLYEPSVDKIGMDGSRAVWLLAQHADLQTMKRVHELFVTLHKKSKRNVFYFGIPFLEDRIRVQEGKQQRFGTQRYVNSAGREELFPVANMGTVNKLRQKYGLDKIFIT